MWVRWCRKSGTCRSAHPSVVPKLIVTGPVGDRIRQLPEGGYISTFMATAHSYGVSPQILMAIGIVESGGGVAGTAYMGCMDYSTFGSWPAQINCAARVLSSYGLAGYNSVNPSYPSLVMGQADGIQILYR